VPKHAEHHADLLAPLVSGTLTVFGTIASVTKQTFGMHTISTPPASLEKKKPR
jgi:hypothetical protein